MSISFIRSMKGSVLLHADGFLYEKDKERDKTYWKCVKYKSISCAGRVHTQDGKIVFDNNSHNHLADASEVEAKLIRFEIKKRAVTNTGENCKKVVSDVLKDVSSTVAVRLPSLVCLERLAGRARNTVYPRSKMMGTDEVRCPICSRIYSKSEIEEHANKCLFLNESSDQSFKRSGSEVESSKASVKSKKQKKESGNFLQVFEPSHINTNMTFKQMTLEESLAPPNDPLLITSNAQEVRSTKNTNSVPHTSKTKNQMASTPLAETMRPKDLNSYVGQDHILTPGSIMYSVFKRGEIPNLILWGPPGCGKSSLASVISNMCKKHPKKTWRFVKLSAAMVGVNEVKDQVRAASNELLFGRNTIIFMDEIHRFNKMQQDIFLPHIEAGTITLIGATTENPSFSLNSSLLSRCRVLMLEKLSSENLVLILTNAVKHLKGLVGSSTDDETSAEIEVESVGDEEFYIDTKSIQWLADTCDGDARIALGGLDLAVKSVINIANEEAVDTKELGIPQITLEDVKTNLMKSHMLYDRKGDEHYNMISALHKSVRASDDNAALYWLARMMAGGEDPVYIARRLVRMATEDIGLADPNALGIAVHTMHACKMIGMPECDVPLAQCVTYLARAPKSRLMEDALRAAQKLVAEHKGPQPGVPLHLRNAPTKLMKNLGYGQGYNMLHKDYSELSYLPEGMEDVDFFSETVIS